MSARSAPMTIGTRDPSASRVQSTGAFKSAPHQAQSIHFGGGRRQGPAAPAAHQAESAAGAAATRCPHERSMRDSSEQPHPTPVWFCGKEKSSLIQRKYSFVRACRRPNIAQRARAPRWARAAPAYHSLALTSSAVRGLPMRWVAKLKLSREPRRMQPTRQPLLRTYFS